MMDKTQLDKNRLDLAYQRRMQQQNAVFLLGTGGILAFVGTFVWNPEKLLGGAVITLVVFAVSFIWYNKLEKDLSQISQEISNLKR